MEAILLQYGIAGVVILSQAAWIKKLYGDLSKTRKSLEMSKDETIKTKNDETDRLERVLEQFTSKISSVGCSK